MKQKLFLGISTQLKMTPQLQQAIKLLQLSTLELQQEIQENLYSNPLLEIDEDASVNTPDDNQTAHESADVP
ncbi:MAG: RNA polymerase factor sigma-54, partial [Pseudomonadales bacterium]